MAVHTITHTYGRTCIKEYQKEKKNPQYSTYKGTDNNTTDTHNNIKDIRTNRKREVGPWMPSLENWGGM